MKTTQFRSCFRRAFGVLSILTLSHTSSIAATMLYQIEFTGELTSITSTAPFWDGIMVGTPFTVTVTYDDAPASSSVGPTLGVHSWSPGLHSLSASFGDYTFSVPAFALEIRNGLAGQSGFIFGNSGSSHSFSSNGLSYASGNAFQAYLIDTNSAFNPITDTTVEAVGPFDLALFNAKSFGIYGGSFNEGADTASVQGVITGYNFSSTPIPEPSTTLLVGSAAFFLASRRRTRRG